MRPLIKAQPKINWDFKNVNTILPQVNAGGCGFFAFYLGEEIKNRYGVEPKFVLLGRGKLTSTKEEVRDLIMNCNSVLEIKNNGIDLHHIMTSVNGKLIDSDGIYQTHKNSKWCYCNKLTKISLSELEKLINMESGWNPMFSRKKSTLTILKKQIVKSLDFANTN